MKEETVQGYNKYSVYWYSNKENLIENIVLDMKSIIWNIRSVNTKKAFERLINMHRQQHFQFIGLVEPMQNARKLEKYRTQLGLAHAFANVSNKVWPFIDEIYDVSGLLDFEQQLTLQLLNRDNNQQFILTLVYARCDSTKIIILWETLYALGRHMTLPWF